MNYKEQNKARFHLKVDKDQYGLLCLVHGTEPRNIQEAIEWGTRRLALQPEKSVLSCGETILDQKKYDQAKKEKGSVYFTDGVVAFHQGDGIWDSDDGKLEIRDEKLRELYKTQRNALSRARDLRDEADRLEHEAEKAARHACYRESDLNLEHPSAQQTPVDPVEEEPAEISI